MFSRSILFGVPIPSYSYLKASTTCSRVAWRVGMIAASAPKIKPIAMAAMLPASGKGILHREHRRQPLHDHVTQV